MSAFARNNPGMFMTGLPKGGGVPPRRYNKGVSYVPGTGNTDTVPAILTPGEAVIPKPMVAKYGGLVNAMVKDQIPGYMAGYYPSVTSQVTRLMAGQPGVIGRAGGFGASGAIGSSVAARRLQTVELSSNAVSSRVMQRVALEEKGDLISVTMGGAQFFVKKSKFKDLESVILQNEKYQTSKGASVDDIFAGMISKVSAPHRNLLGATITPGRLKAILPLDPTTSPVSAGAKARRISYKDKKAYTDLQTYFKGEEAFVKQRLSIDDLVALTAPRAKFEGERLKDTIRRTGDRGLFSLSGALSHGVPAKGKRRTAQDDRADNLFEETNQMNLAFSYNGNRQHVRNSVEAREFLEQLSAKKEKTAFDRYAMLALEKRLKDGFYDRFKTRQDELLMANKGVLTPGGSYGNIPAVLTPGEAVLSKDVVSKYQPLITAMSEGTVPGYAGGVMLGMPMSFAKTQQMRAAEAQIEAAFAKSSYANTKPTNFGHLVESFTGRSFPLKGVGGVYRKPNGKLVVVKPMADEDAANAEVRATTIVRKAHKGLDAPKQTIKTMIDPTDPTGKRKVIVVESPYVKKFAKPTGKFTKKQYISQLVASTLRGDKDLQMANVSANNVVDVGTSGIYRTASGFREVAKTMPSMEEQAIINLLGVKGGAKRFFAEATAPLAQKMTAQQFESLVLAEINAVLPRLQKTVASFGLTGTSAKPYADMIARLEAGKSADWKKIHGIHTNVKPKKYKTGVVSVPGPKGAGDVVPAMLSPGEAVIPAAMTEKYSPLIKGMITDTIPGFKTGKGGKGNPPRPPRGGPPRPLPGQDFGGRSVVKKNWRGHLQNAQRVVSPMAQRAADKAAAALSASLKAAGKGAVALANASMSGAQKVTALGNSTRSLNADFAPDKTRGFRGFVAGFSKVPDTIMDEQTGKERKATIAERTNMRQDQRMQRSQRAMGMGMAAMMVPMVAGAYAQKNPDSGIAKNMDMIMMLSMLAMMAPMLNSPLKMLIASVAGLAIIFKLQSATIRKNVIEGEKQGRSMILATSGLEELGKITGTVSKTQLAAEKRKSRNTDLVPVSMEFGNKVIEETDFGKNLKTSFEQTMADFGTEAGVDSLVSQLGTAVSQGVLTNAQAESIAIRLTRNLKDAKLELNVRGRLIQLLGPDGENLVLNPLQVQVDLIANGKRVQDAAVAELNKVANEQIGINTKGEVGQVAAATVGGGYVAARAGLSAANMMAELSAARNAGGGIGTAVKTLSTARKAGQIGSLGAAATGVGTVPGLVGLAVSTVVLGGIEAGLRNWQKGKEKAAIGKAAGVVQGITSQNLAASVASVDALEAQYNTAIANLELKKKTLKTEQDRTAIDKQIEGLETQKQDGLKTLRSSQADILGSVSASYQTVNKRSLGETLSPFGSGRGQVRDKFMESFAVGMQEKFKDSPILKAQASALQTQLDNIGNDDVTLEVSALVTSDVLTPNEATAMVNAITSSGGDITKDMQAVVNVQGLDGLQRLTTLLTIIPNENNQKNLFVGIKQMNKADGDAVMTAIEQLGIIPDFIGIELGIETQKNDITDLKKAGKEIDALKKQFPNGKIDLKALIKMQEEAGGEGKNLTLDAAIAQWSEIAKLPKELQFQAMITIGTISMSDSFDAILDRELDALFYKKNPDLMMSFVDPKKEAASQAKRKAFKQNPDNVAAATSEYFKKTVPQLFRPAEPPIIPPGGTNTGGDKAKRDTSWLMDLAQRLKIVKDSSIDALSPLASIKKFLGGDVAGQGGGSVKSNKSLDKQLGAIQQIDKLAQDGKIAGLSDDFRDLLTSMDPQQFALWAKVLFKVGKDNRISELTTDFIDINSAFKTATVGEYIESAQKGIDEIRDRVSGYYRLIDLSKEYGFSIADTNDLLKNQSFIADIANGVQYSKEELAGLIEINKQARQVRATETTTGQFQDNNNMQIQIDAFKKLKDAGVEYETILHIISKSEWASAVASSTGNVQEEWPKLIKSATDYKKVLFELQQIQESNATKLDQRFAAEAARITASAMADFRKVNGMSVDQFNVITREKELAQRGFQDQVDAYSEGIQSIEKLEQSVNDKYDAKAKLIDEQIDALDKVRSINEDIAAQQQNQLTLADALTQGDISAAAKAAADYSAQQADIASRSASEALDEQRSAMEVARQKEIDKQITSINGKIYTKKELEAAISKTQEEDIDRLEKEIEKRNRIVTAYEDANTKALANVEINKLTALEWDAIKGAVGLLNEAYDAQVIDINSIATSVGGVSGAWADVEKAIKSASLAVGQYPGFQQKLDVKTYATTKKKNKDGTEVDVYTEGPQAGYTTGGALYIDPGTGGGGGGATDPNKKGTFAEGLGKNTWLHYMPIDSQRSILKSMGYYAQGGFVAKGTDTVPAMLTPGEFVVKRSVADQYGALLQAINSGTYKDLQSPTYSNMSNSSVKVRSGAGNSAADNSSRVYNYNVDINVNSSNSSPNDIAKAVMSEIKYIDSQRIRGQR
jgi:hypothetical protein